MSIYRDKRRQRIRDLNQQAKMTVMQLQITLTKALRTDDLRQTHAEVRKALEMLSFDRRTCE